MKDSTGRKFNDDPYKHIVWLEHVQDSQNNAGSIENMQVHVHISISHFCLNLPKTVKEDNNNSNRRNRIFFMAI